MIALPVGHLAGMTGDQAVRRYVQQRVKLGHYRPATARQVGYVLGSWVRFVGDWREPEPDEIVEWVTQPASMDARHGRASAVRRFYRWATAQRWVTGDVVEMVPTVSGSPKRPKPIPDGVLRRAMLGVDDRERAAIVLGRFAGLRASEIAAVHRDHLVGEQLLVPCGKGGKERMVPAHPEVSSVVGAVRGWVFPSERSGGHVQGQTMSRWLAAALPDPWTAHTLRHAFATQLYAETLDLVLTAKVLGHESTQTTQRYVLPKCDLAAAAVSSMSLAA